jgi:hypothetical protein
VKSNQEEQENATNAVLAVEMYNHLHVLFGRDSKVSRAVRKLCSRKRQANLEADSC